jgi:hypothetical protein
MSGRCAANLSFCGEQDHRRQLAVGTGDVHRGFAEIWFVLAKSDQHPAFWLSHATVCSAGTRRPVSGVGSPARERSRASVSSRALNPIANRTTALPARKPMKIMVVRADATSGWKRRPRFALTVCAAAPLSTGRNWRQGTTAPCRRYGINVS